MALVRIEKKAIPLESGKWVAGIRLSTKSDFALISHGGNTIEFDSKKEANEYLEENY